MKILVVSHEYPPIGGGGASACTFLTEAFATDGYKITIVTAAFRDIPALEQHEGVTIHRVPSKRSHADHCSFFEMLDFIKKAYPLCCKLQEEERFDVCLIFFGIPSGVIGYRLKKKYQLPYIIRFGGGDIPGFQKRFDKVYKILAPAIKTIWKHADRRVANSEGLRDMAYAFCNRYPFDIIHNGADTTLFQPGTETGVSSSKTFRILFVSRLIERKGLQYFMPQLKWIREKTDRPIHLTVVGDGPLEPELKKLTTENGLDDIVSFVGRKEKPEIVRYYQDADLFILPSRVEGMPNVVLEAMACGLPIMITPCPGSAELIKENGYVLEADEFGEKVLEIMADKELLIRCGRRSRQIIEEEFEWQTSARQYMGLMEKVVDI